MTDTRQAAERGVYIVDMYTRGKGGANRTEKVGNPLTWENRKEPPSCVYRALSGGGCTCPPCTPPEGCRSALDPTTPLRPALQREG